MMNNRLKEIRIYFESLEQARHFVLPAINNVINKLDHKKIDIKLIKLTKNSDLYSEQISKILEWKNPDIIVSLVFLDTEVPIFVVEFSAAVFTEDHELQRFDGLVATAENRVVFIKISPTDKVSESGHGGNIDFNYHIPFALIFRKYGLLPFHINWKADGNIVEVDKEYLSCPKCSNEFERVVEVVLKSAGEKGVNKCKLISAAKKDAKLRQWLKDLLKTKISSLNTTLNTSRLKVSGKQIEVKINRFGHAMDPERGMLVFYSVYFKGNAISKMIFDNDSRQDAWYKDIPRETDITNYLIKSRLQKPIDFAYTFYLATSLDSIIDFKEFIKLSTEKSGVLVFDLSKFITNYWISLSKPLKTIFKFSKELRIEDKNGKNQVQFIWQKLPDNNVNAIYSKEITNILPYNEIDEDLVTYITIHSILKPQGYIILSASYPGAQGDRAILVQAGTGRRQERKYIDIISYSKQRDVSAMQANKGKFSAPALNKEIVELGKYKTDTAYIQARKRFLEKFEKNSEKSVLRIGVGFWANQDYSVSVLPQIELQDLDYFVYITKDKTKWVVWKKGNDALLNNYEGVVNIPLIYIPD